LPWRLPVAYAIGLLIRLPPDAFDAVKFGIEAFPPGLRQAEFAIESQWRTVFRAGRKRYDASEEQRYQS